MKHLTTILGIAAMLCFAACEKEEESPSNNSNNSNSSSPYNITFTVNTVDEVGSDWATVSATIHGDFPDNFEPQVAFAGASAGFCYGLADEGDPVWDTTAQNYIDCMADAIRHEGHSMSGTIEQLDCETTYKVRAYLRMADGNIYYSTNTITFTTLDDEDAADWMGAYLTIDAVTSVGANWADFNGNFHSTVTEPRFYYDELETGFVYCETSAGTPDRARHAHISCTPAWTNGGAISDRVTNLTSNTTYNVKAYAIWHNDTIYSSDSQTFTTYSTK